MKHLKLFVALFAMLALGVGNAWAEEVEMSTFTATSAGMDDYISYTTAKGGASTAPAIYDGQIRLYQGEPGGNITISAKEGATITEVTIGSAMATKIKWEVDGTKDADATSLAADEKATKSGISTTSITCHCYGTSKSSRLYVNYLKVVYTVEGGAVTIVKTLKSIAVAGMTTDYETGDIFRFDGTCTATYSVENQEDELKVVTPTSVSTPDMSMAGEQEVTVTYTEGGVTVTATYAITVNLAEGDQLVLATTGVEGTSYVDWSDVQGASGAVYAGNSAGSYKSIQLRSKESSGIITTTSGGLIRKVKVGWNINTAAGRTLNVYGKNTAYTAVSELYGKNTAGELLGTIVYGTSTELVINDDFEYVGLVSANGALYLDKVVLVWDKNEDPDGPTTALDNIAVEGKAVKAIVNGQLIIIKNGVQYNAQGQVIK